MSEEIVSTADIDEALSVYAEKRRLHEQAKKLASEMYEGRELAETALMDVLKKAGKSKWDLASVGSVSAYDSMSIKVPENPEANAQLFEYIVAKHGIDFAMAKFKMHSQTLNVYWNEEFDNAEDKALFAIPGLEAPTAKPTLRFKKA